MLTPAQRANHVVIVGGGFSGTMQAVNLLRHDVPLVTLIEQTPRLARGVAYSTGWKEHLLNVRRANMSAFPDDPGHFDRWVETNHPAIGGAFVPRGVYGSYLEDQLTAAVASMPNRLNILRASVVSLRIRPDQHHMGIDVSPQCEVIDQQGKADQRILALGPMTRGTFWEVVAVPDIRMQTWNVARRIANAHWVGGEGL